MIPFQLMRPQQADCVIILGGGPSLANYDYTTTPGFPVIACNDAAFVPHMPPTIHLAADRPYWQKNAPRRGSLGLWIQPDGEPFPQFRIPGPQAWLPRDGHSWNARLDMHGPAVPLGGGAGPCAVAIAIKYFRPAFIELVGFDGGDKYDKINESIALIAEGDHGVEVCYAQS